MRIVLTGPSGSGKTSICESLSNRYNIVEEPARELIEYFKKFRPEYLPWKNRDLFQTAVEEKTINNWVENTDGIFDRSIIDEVAYSNYYNRDIPQKLIDDCNEYRYDKVFMFPPWKEIFINDSTRQESFEESSGVYNHLLKAYSDFNYSVIDVPKISMKERIKFILGNV